MLRAEEGSERQQVRWLDAKRPMSFRTCGRLIGPGRGTSSVARFGVSDTFLPLILKGPTAQGPTELLRCAVERCWRRDQLAHAIWVQFSQRSSTWVARVGGLSRWALDSLAPWGGESGSWKGMCPWCIGMLRRGSGVRMQDPSHQDGMYFEVERGELLRWPWLMERSSFFRGGEELMSKNGF